MTPNLQSPINQSPMNQSPINQSLSSRQPNSRHCFACGLENSNGLALRFDAIGPDEVMAETVIDDRFQGYPGVVHGGIVAAMLDEVAGRAGMVDDHNHFMVTAKLTVRYRKPVPVGQPLRLVGRVTQRRGRIASAVAEVQLADGTIGADAEATLADWPGEVNAPGQLEALGWKVYPD